MMMDRKKALRILCAEPDTDIRGLKKRYRDLMRKTHPDAVAEHDYTVLTLRNPEALERYDGR